MNNNSKNSGKLVLILFMLAGITMLIGGTVMSVNRKNKDSYYETAIGKVTNVQQSRNDDGKTLYTAVYTYYVDDLEYTLVDDRSSKKRPNIGDTFDIKYNPSDAADAYVSGRVWPGVILAGAGLLFIMSAALGFINNGEGSQTPGCKLAAGLLMGIMVSFMGWGILIACGDEIGMISIPGIILCIFGILGIVVIYKSVKDYIIARKRETDLNGKKLEYIWDTTPAANSRKTGGSYTAGEGSTSYSGSSDYTYQTGIQTAQMYSGIEKDNPVTDFYNEHKDTIDKTVDVVQKGRNIISFIVMIITGLIFVLTTFPMLILTVVSVVTGDGIQYSDVIMIAMAVLFTAIGIGVIVKGIKGLRGGAGV